MICSEAINVNINQLLRVIWNWNAQTYGEFAKNIWNMRKHTGDILYLNFSKLAGDDAMSYIVA